MAERLETRALLSTMTLLGTSGNDVISFQQTDATHDTFSLNGTPDTFSTAGVTSIIINSGAGNDSISVLSDSSGIPLTVSGSGADTVNVGNSGSVQGIQGDLTLSGTIAQMTLTVDDSADSTLISATISSTEISGLAPAAIDYTSGKLGSIAIDGGIGGGVAQPDSFDVTSTAAGTPVMIMGGGSGNGTLLVGPDLNETWNMTDVDSGSVSNIRFSNISEVMGGSGDDTFELGTNGFNGRIDGGAGNNTLVSSNVANSTWTITSINAGSLNGMAFSNIENLTGGSANDSFAFSDNNPSEGPGLVYGAINGGGGTNTLDYSGCISGVTVNLRTGVATFIGGGVTNIQNVVGSSYNDHITAAPGGGVITSGGGNDTLLGGPGNNTFIFASDQGTSTYVNGSTGANTLVGSNLSNTWDITGSNSGMLNGATFANIQNLTGGTVNDDFAFGPSGYVSGAIAGVSGNNTLDYSGRSVAVRVDLQTNSITAVGGGVSNIQNVIGTPANDFIVAASTGTVISGDGGNDTLFGGGGNDTFILAGNQGSSTYVNGSGGTNTLVGPETLVAPNFANNWDITGGNSGTLNGATFANIQNLNATSGLVGWWKGAGNLVDSVGGNNAISVGTSAFVTGEVGQGFSFNGSNYLSVSSTGNPNFSKLNVSTALTIEGWVYLTGNNPNAGLVYKGSLDSDQGAYSLGFYTGSSNRLTFRLNHFDMQVTGNTNLAVGQWYYVAATYDGSTARIYVNGVLDGSTAYRQPIVTSNSEPLYFGTYYAPGFNLNGTLDEVSIYDQALSQAELQSIYNSGSAGKAPAANTFNFGPAGAISGTVTGAEGAMNTLDYSSRSSGVIVNLQTDSATAIGGGFSNFNSLVGGTGPNTLFGANTANTWNISGMNSGSVDAFTFSGIQNLTGGTANNTYDFANGGSISGRIRGGGATDTLNYSALTNGVVVDLSNGVAADTAGVSGVQNVIGSQGNDSITAYPLGSTITANGGDDTLIGGPGNDTFVFTTTPGAGTTVDGRGGANTLIGPNVANTWNITSGNIGTLDAAAFVNMQNLTGGSVSDSFAFGRAGFVSGKVNGGTGTSTLDYSSRSAGVQVSLQGDAATAIGGGFSNIGSLIGGSGSNLLIGANSGNTWNVTGPNSGNVNGKFSFSGIQNLSGGFGVNTFILSNGAGVTGTLNGGHATGEWLDYSAYTRPVSVNLANGTATNIGSVTNFQNVRGGSGGNTLTGDSLGNILIGGSGADTIVGGSGRSILIGDAGVDTVTGRTADDIIIGGTTSYDPSSTANNAALASVLAEWQLGSSYALRISQISGTQSGGANGTNDLIWGNTVQDDGTANTLTGGGGMNWFFQGTNDTITDLQSGEQVNNPFNTVTLDVSAVIDGRDELIIQGNTLQWDHLDWAAVGRAGGNNFPTTITTTLNGVTKMNAVNWIPTWPDPVPNEIRFPATSSVFTSLTPLIPATTNVTLNVVSARYSLSIAQMPTASNGYTTILDFNDDPPFGAATYEGILTFVAPG